MIRNTHSTMTAIKTLFIFLALASVGSVLIDVTLDVKMCEELFLNIKKK